VYVRVCVCGYACSACVSTRNSVLSHTLYTKNTYFIALSLSLTRLLSRTHTLPYLSLHNHTHSLSLSQLTKLRKDCDVYRQHAHEGTDVCVHMCVVVNRSVYIYIYIPHSHKITHAHTLSFTHILSHTCIHSHTLTMRHSLITTQERREPRCHGTR
jgi:hypothetical protein